MREINILYLNTPALYQEDYSPSGFQWLKSDQDGSCYYIFERRCQKQRILFLFQFSDQPYSVSGLSLPGNVRWLEPLINTDWQGSTVGRQRNQKQNTARERTDSRLLWRPSPDSASKSQKMNHNYMIQYFISCFVSCPAFSSGFQESGLKAQPQA